MSKKFDVIYAADRCYIDYHFCRQWDEDGGCYGTAPDHGFTWEEAIEKVAEWYEQWADIWRNLTYKDWAPPELRE